MPDDQPFVLGVMRVSIEFTIVIPTADRLPELQQTVESILRVPLPCEVIIVDDGSRDGTQKYVRSLKNRVEYYRHPLPLGYAESLNAGVELARGTWIGILEPGDRLLPETLAAMCNAIAQHPQAAIVASHDSLTGEIVLPNSQTDSDNELFLIPQDRIHSLMWLDRLDIGMPRGVAVRRDAFLRAGGWVSGVSKYWEAIETWARIAQYGDALLLDRPLCELKQEAQPQCEPSLPEQIRIGMAIKQVIYHLMGDRERLQLAEVPEYQKRLQLQQNLVGLTKEGWLPIDMPAPLHPQHSVLALKALRAERSDASRDRAEESSLLSDLAESAIYLSSYRLAKA
jgi:Glycosyl transferase family 2